MESDNNEKGGCKDPEKCLEILHLILDNEATFEQEKFLTDHIDGCMMCFERYQLEKQIRDLLRNKIQKQPVPQDLLENIRTKIIASA